MPEGSNYCNHCGRRLYDDITDDRMHLHNVFMSPRLKSKLIRHIDDLRELSRYDRSDFMRKIGIRKNSLHAELDAVMRYHGICFYGEQPDRTSVPPVPVEERAMSRRLREVLSIHNVNDLVEFTRYTRDQVKVMHICGETTLKHLQKVLTEAGLSFKEYDK